MIFLVDLEGPVRCHRAWAMSRRRSSRNRSAYAEEAGTRLRVRSKAGGADEDIFAEHAALATGRQVCGPPDLPRSRQIGPNFRTNPVEALPPDVVSEEETLMTKFALYAPLQAKPGKEKEVADFLRSAVPLVNDEPGTVSWFAIQEGPSSFAIFDTFDDEAGRDAHLNGKVAAALMEKIKAGDLFAKTPEIHKLEILADKLPK
jgi:quinol monooxygenase YgiN